MKNKTIDANNCPALVPSLDAISVARQGPANVTRYELEDTVLRAYGDTFRAWDIGDEAASLHAQIAQIEADEKASDEAASAAAAAYAAAHPPVPFSVTPWQIRRALNQAGLRSTIEAAITSQPQDVKDGWAVATEFRRDNAMLDQMATALGMTSAQVDDLFRLAASFTS